MDTSLLLTKQKVWEGYRTTVYDDATGAPIRQSSYVKGNPSIGIGWNLTVPCSDAVIAFKWNEDVQTAIAGASAYSWFAGLNEARQLAIVDMVFNLGKQKLDTFATFLGLMASGDFSGAADDLKTTAWYNQVGHRAVYVAEAIRSGVWD